MQPAPLAGGLLPLSRMGRVRIGRAVLVCGWAWLLTDAAQAATGSGQAAAPELLPCAQVQARQATVFTGRHERLPFWLLWKQQWRKVYCCQLVAVHSVTCTQHAAQWRGEGSLHVRGCWHPEHDKPMQPSELGMQIPPEPDVPSASRTCRPPLAEPSAISPEAASTTGALKARASVE